MNALLCVKQNHTGFLAEGKKHLPFFSRGTKPLKLELSLFTSKFSSCFSLNTNTIPYITIVLKIISKFLGTLALVPLSL
jgi:hypothetical protein